MKRIFVWLTASCLFFATPLVLIPVFAQTVPPNIAMSVSPPTFELTGEKGQTLTEVIKFENPNAFPLSLTTSARNFTAVGEEGAVGLTTEDTAFSLASWIAVSPQTAVVQPKSTVLFTYTVTIPQNAESGGHFGSIVFSTKPEQNPGQGAVVTQELGDLILLKIPGSTNLDWNIESFTPEKNIFWSKPLKFSLRVKNSGDVHIKPTGTVVITNLFGQSMTQDLTPENILPGALRRFDTTLSPRFLLGPYSARVTVDVNGQQKTTDVSFWALPGKMLLICSVVFVIMLLIIMKGRKRFGRAFRVLVSQEKSA